MRRFLLQRETLLGAAILALIAAIAGRHAPFASPSNLALVFNDTAILAILALGQMMVILTRCIDLSMASNLALTGMVAAMLNAAFPEIPIPALMAGCVVFGGLLGAFNGILVWKLDIPPIVVTLGTLAIFRGFVFVISSGQWVNAHEMSPAFKALPRAVYLGLPVMSWIAIAVIIVVGIVMTRTPLGRSFYAVGVNPTASVYAGIDVGRTKFFAFTIAGMISGLAGYLWVTRFAVAFVDTAGGFELEIIAACVIGGISIAGGIGSVNGAVLGALFLGVVKNALPVIDISPFWQLAISGTVIILAVIFNARAQAAKGKIILKSAEKVGTT